MLTKNKMTKTDILNSWIALNKMIENDPKINKKFKKTLTKLNRMYYN